MADGMVFYFPSSTRDDAMARRLRGGRWPAAHVLATHIFRKEGTMLDVGGNVGLTSIPRAILGHFDKIHVFEPDPLNWKCLDYGIFANNLNQIISAHQLAVGASDGEVELEPLVRFWKTLHWFSQCTRFGLENKSSDRRIGQLVGA
jgi:hypothetical protein